MSQRPHDGRFDYHAACESIICERQSAAEESTHNIVKVLVSRSEVVYKLICIIIINESNIRINILIL